MDEKRFPQKLLFTFNDIEKICDDYIKKDKEKSWFVFCLGIIIPTWIAFFSMLDGDWTHGKTVYITITVVLTFIAIVLGVIAGKNNSKKKMIDLIKEKAIEDADYSALFIISKITTLHNGRKRIKILLQPKESWNCDFLPHIDIDKKISLQKQNSLLVEGLASKLNVRAKDLTITLLEDVGGHSIKHSIPENAEKMFLYEFYNVSVDNYLQNDLMNRGKWIDIDDLSENIDAIKVNGDVIEKLMHIKSRITDSFTSNYTLENRVKIIWNITKNCSFNCKICATCSESRVELSKSEKAQALLSILTIKDSIEEFNFAGGDPLQSEDSKEIIKSSMNLMDKSRISISTTGKGIDSLSNSEKYELLNSCVLTIDTPDYNSKGVRSTISYNKLNARNATKYANYINKLRINVPIVNPDLSDKEILSLVNNINKINPEEVALIKLMPVGKVTYNNYPEEYDVKNFIDIFTSELNADIQFHMHCALRCEYCNENNYCNMLTSKIGIDCSGNVFSCCWAGYLNCDIKDNPFYIGNLLENDLGEILKGDRVTEINEEVDRTKCNIFSWYENNKVKP